MALKVIWLGQAGFLLENANCKILIDPYLSDSVAKVNPANARRKPVDERFLKIRPDVIVCTHNHLDHVDPETLAHYLPSSAATVLAPEAAWTEVRKFGGQCNYVKFNRHCEWTEKGIRFTAVKAEHSDIHPIGVVIDDGDRKYYFTGDTLYNTDIFADLPAGIDWLFLPVNGKGNNMNMEDAARFAARVSSRHVVPCHWGLFDDLDPREFRCPRSVIPEMYMPIPE